MTQRLNSKACSGNTPVLQALANSRHRHQLAIAHCVCSWMLKVVMIDYMPHRLTVTRVYYADILRKLLVAVKKKCRGKLTPVSLLLHDNASAHRSHVGQAAVAYLNVDWRKEMCHPAFSWSDTKWLPSVSRFKETSLWPEVFDWWWAQVSGKRVVEGTVRTILFYRH